MDPDDITNETKILGRRPRASNKGSEPVQEPEPIRPKAPHDSVDDDDLTRPTRPLARPGGRNRSDEEKSTRLLDEARSNKDAAESEVIDDDDNRTRIAGGWNRPKGRDSKAPETKPAPQEVEEVEDGMSDPVVGFLIVVKGPGKGKFARLGHGQNAVGRVEGRVKLDFGDKTISRSRHCIITYEPRGREYVVRTGEGDNITYVNNSACYDVVSIKSGDVIEVGETHLRLLPLCGPDFDWSDTEDKEEPEDSAAK